MVSNWGIYIVCRFNNRRFIIWHSKSGGWAFSSLTDSLTELHCLFAFHLFVLSSAQKMLSSFMVASLLQQLLESSPNKKGFFPCAYQGSSFPRDPPAVFLLVSINQGWVTCPFLSQSCDGKEIGYFYFWFGLIHTQSRRAMSTPSLEQRISVDEEEETEGSQRLPLKLLFK